MAIPCPGCGRQYDVTLFPFGRTIRCTCGRRVGLEHRLALPETGSNDVEPRFAADAMLGRLARWLRILGYDTFYDSAVEDGDLVRRAVAEGRHLLTRDRRLPEEWRIDGCTVLASDDPLEQLRAVLQMLGARPAETAGLFSRCPACNDVLVDADRLETRGSVPLRVWESHEAFSRCPGCGKIYWQGSHTRRIRRRLEALRGDGDS